MALHCKNSWHVPFQRWLYFTGDTIDAKCTSGRAFRDLTEHFLFTKMKYYLPREYQAKKVKYMEINQGFNCRF